MSIKRNFYKISATLLIMQWFMVNCGNNIIDNTGSNEENSIAFPYRVEGLQQIFTIKLDGSGKKQLTNIGNNAMPSWSPGGNKIAFTRSDNTGANTSIWTMKADGSDQQLIIPNGQGPDWGVDNRIVYTGSLNGSAELFIYDLQNGSNLQLTQSTGSIHASWSPDGSHIAFVRIAAQQDDDISNGCPELPFAPDIWIIKNDGTDEYELTDLNQSYNIDIVGDTINSAFDANASDWSPTSGEIAFWSGQEGCFGQIWKINQNGSNRTQLTEAPLPFHNDDPAWSPDGTQILFTTDRNGNAEIWIMNSDGSNQIFLTESSPSPLPADPAWRPLK